MSLSLKLYQALLKSIVTALEFIPPRRIEREEVELRKGHYAPESDVPAQTIWIHGASLGEAITLRPLLKALGKAVGSQHLLGTAITMDGLKRLRADDLAEFTSLMPIELPDFLNPFLDRLHPALVLIAETELWPLMLSILQRRRIPYGIINGRINPRTVKIIRLFFSLFRTGLDGLKFVLCQNQEYADRFARLGISREKIHILGSFKYDLEPPPGEAESLRKCYGFPPGRTVICFGSTHPGEDEQILEALEPLWPEMNATIILAPRHLKRVEEIERLLQEKHLDYSRLTQHRRPLGRVLLVDQLGDLRSLYALSDLAFVGGSLIKHGGQNILEPAACGVPVICGPHTFNFPSESAALKKADALVEVHSTEELRQAIHRFFEDPVPWKLRGERGRETLNQLAGASARTIDFLKAGGYLNPCLPHS